MANETVLIVDDDAAIRETLHLVMEDEGYTVLVAEDGQAALELIPTLPTPTVILLDLRMPRLDGYEVLRDLVAHPEKRKNHAIFLVTAHRGLLSIDMMRLLQVLGVSVIGKPFDLESLLTEVRCAFDRLH